MRSNNTFAWVHTYGVGVLRTQLNIDYVEQVKVQTVSVSNSFDFGTRLSVIGRLEKNGRYKGSFGVGQRLGEFDIGINLKEENLAFSARGPLPFGSRSYFTIGGTPSKDYYRACVSVPINYNVRFRSDVQKDRESWRVIAGCDVIIYTGERGTHKVIKPAPTEVEWQN